MQSTRDDFYDNQLSQAQLSKIQSLPLATKKALSNSMNLDLFEANLGTWVKPVIHLVRTEIKKQILQERAGAVIPTVGIFTKSWLNKVEVEVMKEVNSDEPHVADSKSVKISSTSEPKADEKAQHKSVEAPKKKAPAQAAVAPSKLDEQEHPGWIIKSQDTTSYVHGRGPLDYEGKSFQYVINFLVCTLKETSTSGIVMAPVDSEMDRIKDVNLAGMQMVIQKLEQTRESMYSVKENKSGQQFYEKLLKILDSLSMEDKLKMSTYLQTSVLNVLERSKASSVIPQGKGEYSHIVSYGGVKRALWVKPMKVSVKNAAPPKIKAGRIEDDSVLRKQVGWISMVTTAMGGTGIEAMSHGLGLSPSVDKTESEVIRFISVALYMLSRDKQLIVNAPPTAMTMLYTTLLSYLPANKGMLQTDGDKLEKVSDAIKRLVVYDPIGHKAAVRTQCSALFGQFVGDEENRFKVYWLPKPYSSCPTTADTLRQNEKHYDFMADWENYAIFREVLNPSSERYYYCDGFPGLFNFWETTEEIRAVTFDGKKYSEQLLDEIQSEQLFERARAYAIARLRWPYSPSTLRSNRCLVPRGNARLTASVQDDDEVFLGFNNSVMDESDWVDETNEPEEEPEDPDESVEEEGDQDYDEPPKKKKAKPVMKAKKEPPKKPEKKRKAVPVKKGKKKPREESSEEEEESGSEEVEEFDEEAVLWKA